MYPAVTIGADRDPVPGPVELGSDPARAMMDLGGASRVA
jgi:hypothetical protein